MPNNRLEFYYSKETKVAVGCIMPILLGGLGGCGIWGLWVEGNADLPGNKLGELLMTLMFWLFLLLLRLTIPKVFAKEPKIIVDEEGVTDNRGWKALTIPWDDINEISFPIRVYHTDRDYALHIRFNDPQKYHSKIPLLPRVNILLSAYGDLEISFRHLDGKALDVYYYLLELQEKVQIPSYLQISIEETYISPYF